MKPSFDLSGRTAIVTGANTGIGQAVAVALAGAGAAVLGVGRSSMADTDRMISDIGGRFASFSADLATIEPVDAIVEAALSTFGSVDILVNNAGIIRRADAIDFTEADWDEVMNVNLKSAFFLSQAVAKRMLPRDAARSSTSHHAVLPGRYPHSLLHRLQEWPCRSHATSCLRMGAEGHQCKRDRAGYFVHQQYDGSAR